MYRTDLNWEKKFNFLPIKIDLDGEKQGQN